MRRRGLQWSSSSNIMLFIRDGTRIESASSENGSPTMKSSSEIRSSDLLDSEIIQNCMPEDAVSVEQARETTVKAIARSVGLGGGNVRKDAASVEDRDDHHYRVGDVTKVEILNLNLNSKLNSNSNQVIVAAIAGSGKGVNDHAPYPINRAGLTKKVWLGQLMGST